MCGKMTTSRMGIMGNFRVSNFSLDVVTKKTAPSCELLAWNLAVLARSQ
jgi:hypothetical protein